MTTDVQVAVARSSIAFMREHESVNFPAKRGCRSREFRTGGDPQTARNRTLASASREKDKTTIP